MKKILLTGLTAVSLAVWGVGCATPTSPTTVESYPQTKITLNSAILASRLEVVGVASTNRNNLLQAQVQAKNTTRYNLQFEYRYRWQDAAGMAISGNELWTPVNVGAHELALMQGIAPAAEAAAFIFDVRFRQQNTRWE
ncbi:MAG: DUF1425 domain-containing protein [bacterium]